MTKIKILLAEDEPQIARLVQFQLSRESFEVVWQDNGQRAWEEIQKNLPDLVLLDVMMPVMDGFDVLERIREDERYKHLPVIMFTARGREKDILRAKELGANHYIVKPFDINDLIDDIREILQTPE